MNHIPGARTGRSASRSGRRKPASAPVPTPPIWKNGAVALDRAAALRLVLRFMAIPGSSGREGKVLAEIRSELRAAGVAASELVEDRAHKRSPLGGEAGNLIVKLPGTLPGPRRLFMAHVDTVPLCVGTRPVRKGDRVVSRRADCALGADDRAGTAVILHSLTEICRRRLPHPPLTFLWLVQEEVGLLGARFVDRKALGGPRLCFNWDGGDAEILTIGATGGVELRIGVHGVASHAGAHPERGVSAIAVAGTAISALVRDGWHGLVIKGGSTGTSNVGTLAAGDATNVVCPALTLRAEVRSHDPRFRQRIIDAYRTAFQDAARAVANDAGATATIEFDIVPKYESFRIPEDSPSVLAAARAIERVGLCPDTRISNGGLDANWMTSHGLPTVTLGCGQRDVHTVNESLNIEAYLNACRIALLLATGVG